MPFEVPDLAQAGVWTPRPWSKSHPDTGAGDPSAATAEGCARALKQAGAKVIGLDHAFAIPVEQWYPDNDRKLAEAVATAPIPP